MATVVMRKQYRSPVDGTGPRRDTESTHLKHSSVCVHTYVCVFVHKHRCAAVISSLTDHIPQKYQVCVCGGVKRDALRVQLRPVTPTDLLHAMFTSVVRHLVTNVDLTLTSQDVSARLSQEVHILQ